jgi:HK97 family phage portal protein
MPGFFSRLFRAPDTKISRAAPLMALYSQGRPLWSERETRTLAEAGFRRNAIVHRCVKLVSESASAIPLVLKEGREELHAHPLMDLLARPNPREAGVSFMEGVFGHLMVSGNAYIEAVSVDNAPRELYALRPDRMRVVPGPRGWPEAYDYTVGAQHVRYQQDGVAMPPILHLMLLDPIDDYYGFPPLAAAQMALDVHNAATAWNKALLDNSARPSGALVYTSDGQNMSDEQFSRLKDELEANFQGAVNAGRPILLEGGLDWKPLSLSPRDMDFLEAKNSAAREIALAFGVPPLLLGLPGDNTHANYAEANRAFYRNTLLPLVTRTAQSLARWVAPIYGDSLSLEPDVDRIEALATERAALWGRVAGVDFLTADEKREAVGYGVGRKAS